MIVVSNSSPLIALSAVGLFELLATLYGAINIPQAVYLEVAVSGSGHFWNALRSLDTVNRRRHRFHLSTA
jgi:predicted nucleic acid-binding protein